MKYIDTRNQQPVTNLTDAIRQGLTASGGLFVPEYIPEIDLKEYVNKTEYANFSSMVLNDYFAGDVLQADLQQICNNAFTFPLPLTQLNGNTWLLELFHGPTLSFKDFGARFLAECLQRIPTEKKMTIMVATSGDTGSAVASALHGKKNINVIILYPKGKISKRQEQQITCWGDNVIALAVRGNFDDCQHLVKSAFQDKWWQEHFTLGSANSINVGRLLPQITYYAFSSMQYYQQYHQLPGYIVPTGNLGNATAAYYAKLMGFPIREIVLATNANMTLVDYLQTGKFIPRQTIATLANAMDVGNPSNFERLQYLFNTFESFKKNVRAFSVSDDEIRETIVKVYREDNKIICPHTATACFVRQKLSDEPWVVVATADACKFDSVVEPLIHAEIPQSAQMLEMCSKPVKMHEVENNLEAVRECLSLN